MPDYSPYAIQHINLSVPNGTLALAEEFYGEILGFPSDPVPQLQRDTLRWFHVGDGPQQIHVSFGPVDTESRSHPCFSLPSLDALLTLQRRIYDHHVAEGPASAQQADRPGDENSGAKGVEYPSRFFARDYAGNRLEFSVHPRE